HHFLRDQHLLDIRLRRDLVHQVHHDAFHDGPEPPGSRLALKGLPRDGAQRTLSKFQMDVLHVKQFLILTHQSILGFGQDSHQRLVVEFAQGGNHGQTSDELRNQTELEQVLGLHFVKQLRHGLGIAMGQIGAKAHGLAGDASADDVVEPHERAAAYEEDVGGGDLEKFLLRVLAPALGPDRRHGAFDDLEQRLLDALAGNVAGNRGVVTLARNLVDFVDVYDAALASLDIVVGVLQQRQDDVLDVLADVSGLGQRGCVG